MSDQRDATAGAPRSTGMNRSTPWFKAGLLFVSALVAWSLVPGTAGRLLLYADQSRLVYSPGCASVAVHCAGPIRYVALFHVESDSLLSGIGSASFRDVDYLVVDWTRPGESVTIRLSTVSGDRTGLLYRSIKGGAWILELDARDGGLWTAGTLGGPSGRITIPVPYGMQVRSWAVGFLPGRGPIVVPGLLSQLSPVWQAVVLLLIAVVVFLRADMRRLTEFATLGIVVLVAELIAGLVRPFLAGSLGQALSNGSYPGTWEIWLAVPVFLAAVSVPCLLAVVLRPRFGTLVGYLGMSGSKAAPWLTRCLCAASCVFTFVLIAQFLDQLLGASLLGYLV